jgi:hypothetical protein
VVDATKKARIMKRILIAMLAAIPLLGLVLPATAAPAAPARPVKIDGTLVKVSLR